MSGPFWPGVAVPVRVLFMGQIDLPENVYKFLTSKHKKTPDMLLK